MTHALMFDLDNTLYSETTGMELHVLERINEFVSDYLGWPLRETNARRREGAKRFGTTLEWLVFEMGLKDVERYFAYTHPEGEEACLHRDDALRALLESIDLPKTILTNSPLEHAVRVLNALGIADCFSAVYDIRWNGLVGKPHPKSYLKALEASGFRPETTLFIDDHPRYVKGYSAIGGRGLLKDEGGRFADLGMERITSLEEIPGLL
jgi:putative hydrolase of the HAD superfamily